MSKLIAKSEQPLEQRLAISRSMRVARRSWHLRIRIDTPPGAGAVPLVGEASGFFMPWCRQAATASFRCNYLLLWYMCSHRSEHLASLEITLGRLFKKRGLSFVANRSSSVCIADRLRILIREAARLAREKVARVILYYVRASQV